MAAPDLNLLVTLEVLLAEGSVAAAARRLRLSPSAMSRALARLRSVTGDPLLVRAGRGLVATPHALALRERVGPLVQEGQSLLRPAAAKADLSGLRRSFTLCTADGFVETFGAALLARIASQAPGVRLRFVAKPGKDNALLRDGSADLETAVIGATTREELRAQALFRDHFVGVVAPGHALAKGRVTSRRYADASHVLVSQRGLDKGVADDALASLSLTRRIVTVVSGFSSAVALARTAGLVATVPERHCAGLRTGLRTFALPMAVPEITVSMLWHQRLDADPAHRWLRRCVKDICAQP